MIAAHLLALRLLLGEGAAAIDDPRELAAPRSDADPSATPPTAEATAPPLRHYTLQNGLQVVLEVDRSRPLVAVVVTYQVGTRDGPDSRRQLPHVVEHLMFEGTRHVSKARRDDALYVAAAARINASTTFDSTVYYTVVPPTSVATVLWLESERMGFLRGHHEEATLAPARTAVLHELRQRRDGDDLSRLFIRLHDALYPPGDPYHGIVDATLGGADEVTLFEVNRFLRRWYTPRNAVLSLVGDLPPDTEAIIERFFGPLRAGPKTPTRRRGGVPLTAEVVLRERSPVDAPIVVMAWRTPALHSDGDAAADVFARVLGHAGQSGLLRGPGGGPGPIVRVEADHASHALGSMLVVIAHGRPGAEAEPLRAAVDGLLARFAAAEVDPALITSAAREVVLAQRVGMESSINRAASRASYLATVGAADWFEEDLARARRVNTAAITGLVKDVLRRENRVVIVAAPEGG